MKEAFKKKPSDEDWKWWSPALNDTITGHPHQSGRQPDFKHRHTGEDLVGMTFWKSSAFSVWNPFSRLTQGGCQASHTYKKKKIIGLSLNPPGRHLQVPLPQQSLPDCGRCSSSLSPSGHTAALRGTLQRPRRHPPSTPHPTLCLHVPTRTTDNYYMDSPILHVNLISGCVLRVFFLTGGSEAFQLRRPNQKAEATVLLLMALMSQPWCLK